MKKDIRSSDASTHGLAPVLRFRDLVLFYIVTITSIRHIAMASAAGPSIVVMLFVTVLLFLAPQLAAVAELSSRYPDEGGLYVWTRRAFGDLHAFFAAWAYWTSILAFFPSLLYFAASNATYIVPSFAGLAEDTRVLAAFSLVAILFITVLNVRGLDVAQVLHNVGSYFSLWIPLGLLLVMAVVAWFTTGPATDFSPQAFVPDAGLTKNLLFLAVLAYAFAGYEGASLLGDEVHNARRTIPYALLASGAIIAVGYGLVAISMLSLLDAKAIGGLTGLVEAIRVGGVAIGGEPVGNLAATVFGLCLLVGAIGGASAWLAATSRLPFVIGLDNFLPAAFSRLHPRFGTPYVGILVLSAASAIFVLLAGLGGTAEQIYNVLISLEIVIFFIPYLYMFAALIVLQREPAGESVIQASGGKAGAFIAGGVGFLVTLFALGAALVPGEDVTDPLSFYVTVFGSLAVNLAIGLGLYLYGKRRQAAAAAGQDVS